MDDDLVNNPVMIVRTSEWIKLKAELKALHEYTDTLEKAVLSAGLLFQEAIINDRPERRT